MTEPTIICPNCKSEIKLTESLAAPLIDTVRKQFQEKLAEKDVDIAKREQALQEQEKSLSESRRKIDQQIAEQVSEQLKKDRTRYRCGDNPERIIYVFYLNNRRTLTISHASTGIIPGGKCVHQDNHDNSRMVSFQTSRITYGILDHLMAEEMK